MKRNLPRDEPGSSSPLLQIMTNLYLTDHVMLPSSPYRTCWLQHVLSMPVSTGLATSYDSLIAYHKNNQEQHDGRCHAGGGKSVGTA